MRKNKILTVFLFFALVFCLPTMSGAQGNFLDTLQGPQEEGVSGKVERTTEPEEPTEQLEPEASPSPDEADEAPNEINFQQVNTEALIAQIIKAITESMGSLPPGTKIIIVLPKGCVSGPRPTPPPTTPPTTTPPPTTPPPTTPPPTTTPPPSGAPTAATAEDKAKLEKFGIKATDGDVAWSKGQVDAIAEVLEKLPSFFSKWTKEIKRESVFKHPYTGQIMRGVLGYVRSDRPSTVNLMNLAAMGSSLAAAKSGFQGTFVHEATHTFQHGNPDVTNAWKQTFWPGGREKSRSVSGYGDTQPVEDMAESVRVYFQQGARMKSSHPDRYEFIRKYVMNGQEF